MLIQKSYTSTAEVQSNADVCGGFYAEINPPVDAKSDTKLFSTFPKPDL
jgi:hypothetical protein